MAYFVVVISAFLVFSALTALRPGRKGIFAPLAFPVGWAAGELAAQAVVLEAALLGVLGWWGWPRTGWLSLLVWSLAGAVLVENLALVAISFRARTIVRRAMRGAPSRPLEIPRPDEDVFGSWWRTALQFPYHPRSMQLVANIPYGPEQRHRLDVWRTSTTRAGAPVIFYIHGGAWAYGDKREQGRPMLHEFVARGWVAVVINYRLAPGNPLPAQIEDATRALGWIKRTIHTYGGDADRVVVSGGSAGGHLAALLALSSEDPTWRPEGPNPDDWSVRGAIAFYGVLEMTGDERHWHGLGWGIRRLLVNHVVQLPFEEHEDVYRALSPYDRIHVDAPPFLVVQGGNDTLVDVNVARDFVERFRQVAFAPAYYIELPFTQHAFDVTASPRTSATTRAAVAFAESVVAKRPVLDAQLVASYQVPPTELTVRLESGEWVDAKLAATELGPFTVLTSDNPYSQLLDERENARRRDELLAQLRARELVVRDSKGRNLAGEWPVEEGFALVGGDVALARTIARAWDQFAVYEVDEHRVRVHSVATGEVLA